MGILRRIKGYFYWIIMILISKVPTKRERYYDVIIVKVCLIGDFVMSYDPLMEMKKNLKGKRVLLICPSLVKNFVEDDLFFTDIIYFDLKKSMKILYWLKFSRYIRRLHADTIYYSEWERFANGDLMINAIKSDNKIAMRCINGNRALSWYFDRQYATLLDFPKESNELKQMEYFIKKTINPDYEYGHNPMICDSISFSKINRPYIVVSMSSSVEKKMWPLDRFAAVINSLPKELTVVLSGSGKDDIRRADVLVEMADKNHDLINYVNKTSLLELKELIGKSLLVIGNDSSAVHIAAATRVPSICILHGAHFNRFFPYPKGIFDNLYIPRIIYHKMDCFNCNYKCIYDNSTPYECLKMVTVEKVKNEVSKLLREIGYN